MTRRPGDPMTQLYVWCIPGVWRRPAAERSRGGGGGGERAAGSGRPDEIGVGGAVRAAHGASASADRQPDGPPSDPASTPDQLQRQQARAPTHQVGDVDQQEQQASYRQPYFHCHFASLN